MNLIKEYEFSAKIYKIGINWCVDVPDEIRNCLIIKKGKSDIKGNINGFAFTKTLMPVKNSEHRLFVNKAMMTGGQTALGRVAIFRIEQDYNKEIKEYLMPNLLTECLINNSLMKDFDKLTISKKRAILKYFSFIKTEETLVRNINKLLMQLKNKEKNIRVP